MRVLALDPATKCGWAIAEDGTLSHSGTWDLSTRSDESNGMKLLRLESKLVEITKSGVIDLVAYETPAQHTYPLALISHAKFIGVIERYCTRHGINYCGYAPTAIKKSATGKGNAKKEIVADAIRKRYPDRSIEDDNEADAIALLHLALGDYAKDKGAPF